MKIKDLTYNQLLDLSNTNPKFLYDNVPDLLVKINKEYCLNKAQNLLATSSDIEDNILLAKENPEWCFMYDRSLLIKHNLSWVLLNKPESLLPSGKFNDIDVLLELHPTHMADINRIDRELLYRIVNNAFTRNSEHMESYKKFLDFYFLKLPHITYYINSILTFNLNPIYVLTNKLEDFKERFPDLYKQFNIEDILTKFIPINICSFLNYQVNNNMLVWVIKYHFYTYCKMEPVWCSSHHPDKMIDDELRPILYEHNPEWACDNLYRKLVLSERPDIVLKYDPFYFVPSDREKNLNKEIPDILLN